MRLLDGGSTSIAKFVPTPAPPIPEPLSKLWTSAHSLTSPSAVLEWHTSFLKAGADIITTNTYQIPLAADAPGVDIPKLMYAAVSIAVKAVQGFGRGSVALSLGSRNAGYGKGEYCTQAKATVEEYRTFHERRIKEYEAALGLLLDDIQYIAFETVSSYEEAEAILSVLSAESRIRRKAWISFSCGDASIPRMQDIFSRLMKLPTISALWGIGFNCIGYDIVIELAKMLANTIKDTGVTLVIYADAGRWHEKTTAQFTYDTPVMEGGYVKEWAETMMKVSGLNHEKILLGGCCNTDYRFISMLARLRDEISAV